MGRTMQSTDWCSYEWLNTTEGGHSFAYIPTPQPQPLDMVCARQGTERCAHPDRPL